MTTNYYEVILLDTQSKLKKKKIVCHHIINLFTKTKIVIMNYVQVINKDDYLGDKVFSRK